MMDQKLNEIELLAQQLPKGPYRCETLKTVARHREAVAIGHWLAGQSDHHSILTHKNVLLVQFAKKSDVQSRPDGTNMDEF